jgi:SulP family sulfate permease
MDTVTEAARRFRFTRMELAGALGDLGTLLPLAVGLILVNGLDPAGLFLAVGLFYVGSGMYYGVVSPVQPMKVVSAYAIAMALTPGDITAAGILISLSLLVIAATGLIGVIDRITPKPVVRGIQLSTGVILMTQGVTLMLGDHRLQEFSGAAEPYLAFQALGPVPIGIILGAVFAGLTLLTLDNRRLPAGIIVVAGGMLVGVLLGAGESLGMLDFGLHFPSLLPFGLPAWTEFSFAMFALVLPQLPMTIGNAVLADADLSKSYFGQASERVTPRSLCYLMAIANGLSALLGGMPVCTGAGGLAAHYRFGARTGGANLMIGGLIILLVVLFGGTLVHLLQLLPLGVLGVLLVFAGLQLALTILDLDTRTQLFVALVILGVALASNLAWGFIVGVATAYAVRRFEIRI